MATKLFPGAECQTGDGQDGQDLVVDGMAVTERLPVHMFRRPTLSNVLKVSACMSAVLVLAAIPTAISFHFDSYCLKKCEEFAMSGFPEQDYSDSEPALDEQKNNTEGMAVEKKSNRDYEKCHVRCFDQMEPLKWAMCLYIVHLCFVFGLAFRVTYASFLDFVAIRIFDCLEVILLTTAWLILIMVRVDDYSEENNRKYLENSPGLPKATFSSLAKGWSLNLGIAAGAFCLVLHIAQAINHRNVSRSTIFPSRHQGETAFRVKCCQNLWFSHLLKLTKWLVALATSTAHIVFLGILPRPGLQHWQFVVTHLAVIIWHAVVCFMVGSWNGRYRSRRQVQVEQAFYVIQFTLLIGLAYFDSLVVYSLPLQEVLDCYLLLLVIAVLNLGLLVVDVAVRRFPRLI